MKETALVICPGRGTYTRTELGSLARRHGTKTALLEPIEAERVRLGQTPVLALDGAESWRASVHATSQNASALIHACAMGDLADIDRDRFDIVAMTGNSMGWYLALTGAGALSPQAGIMVVNTMGTLMEREGVGGQVVYPLVDEEWRADTARARQVMAAVAEVATQPGADLHVSIRLGGLLVFAGTDTALDLLMERLPADDRFPLRLAYHAAFHSPLLAHVPPQAGGLLPPNLFTAPTLPLVDGRGRIWSPFATAREPLQAYTFGPQIETTYDFSAAVETAVKEFAPDRIIILGPGSTLGAPVAQILIRMGWWGLTSKTAFLRRQATDPVVLAMGIEEQRLLAMGHR